MFDDPSQTPAEQNRDPKARAEEKCDEMRLHAQLAAVFEGVRKFDAELRAGFDPELARDVQKRMARIEKGRLPDLPILGREAADEAAEVLKLPEVRDFSTNDYHVHRRPGEVMIVRWLAGDQVETFYQRFQAHFDAAMEGLREDERQANEWRQDPGLSEYLAALDGIKLKMADTYLRDAIRQHRFFVLSTQTADEFNIEYLAGHMMDVTASDLVGEASAPPDGATEQDLAWFFKLFALRGMIAGEEKMCFFTYLQKAEESGW